MGKASEVIRFSLILVAAVLGLILVSLLQTEAELRGKTDLEAPYTFSYTEQDLDGNYLVQITVADGLIKVINRGQEILSETVDPDWTATHIWQEVQPSGAVTWRSISLVNGEVVSISTDAEPPPAQ